MALSGFNRCSCPEPVELEQRCFPLRNEENDYPAVGDLPEVPEYATEDTPFRIPLFDTNYYTDNTYDVYYGNHQINAGCRWLPIFENVSNYSPIEITVRDPDADTTGDRIQQAQKFTSNIGFFMPILNTGTCDITYSFKFLDELNTEIKTFSCTWNGVTPTNHEYSYNNTYATDAQTQLDQTNNFNNWRRAYCIQTFDCLPYERSLLQYQQEELMAAQNSINNPHHSTEIVLAPDLINAACAYKNYDTKRTFLCNSMQRRIATNGVSFSLGAGNSFSLDPTLDGTLYYDYIVLLRDNDKVHVYYGEDLKPGRYTRAKNDIYPCNEYRNDQYNDNDCYSRVMASRYICSFDMSRYAKMMISVSIKSSTYDSCDVLLDGVSPRSDIAGRGLSFSSIYIPSKAVDNTGEEYHPCPYPIQPVSPLLTGRWPAMVRHYFMYSEGNALLHSAIPDHTIRRKATNLAQRFLPDELGQIHMAFTATTRTLGTVIEPIYNPKCEVTESCVCKSTNNTIVRSEYNHTETSNNRFVGEVAGGIAGDTCIDRVILQDSFIHVGTTTEHSTTLLSGITSSGRPYAGLYFLLGPVDYVAALISYKYDGAHLSPYAFCDNNCEQATLYPLPDPDKHPSTYTVAERKNIVYNDIKVYPTHGLSDMLPNNITGVLAIDEANATIGPGQPLSFDRIKQMAHYTVRVTPACDILGTDAACAYTADGYLNSRALQVIEFVMDLNETRTGYSYYVGSSYFSGNYTSNAKLLADASIPCSASISLNTSNDITYTVVGSSTVSADDGFSAIVDKIQGVTVYVRPEYLARKNLCDRPFCTADRWKTDPQPSRVACEPIIYQPTMQTTELQIYSPFSDENSNFIYIYPSRIPTPRKCSTEASCTYDGTWNDGTSITICLDNGGGDSDGFDESIPKYRPHLHIFSFIKEAPRSGYLFHYPREQLSPDALVHYSSTLSKKVNLPKLIEYLHETLP